MLAAAVESISRVPYVGEKLYQAVSSVIAGKVDSAITAVRKIGHSSGWDMLTGIATTLKIFATARLEA